MIDLHAHTTISDGTFSPTEVICLAKEAGLTAIAITDHDTIDGLEEAQNEADKLGITLVPGIEFSAVFGENRLIHILGLGINPRCDGFLEIYSRYRKERSEKLAYVFEKLSALGVAIDPEKVEPFTVGGLMDRQAIAKYMAASGITQSVRESWIHYLDKIDYIAGELIQPEDAFAAIHAGGGKAFLAHYHLKIGLKGYSDEEVRERLTQIKTWGLDGMEAHYPSFTEEDKQRCERYIEDFGFLKSGGSDFHGTTRAHVKLGVGAGDLNVPDELLEQFLGAGC